MPFDGLTIRSLCQELEQEWSKARIDKIYQPEKNDLVFHIRSMGKGNFRLLFSANARWARMHITQQKHANPKTAPAFCMLLRKYLEGGKVKSMKQLGFERIVHLEIEALDELRDWKNKLIICEFMGKHSNIILVNPETNLIMDAFKKYGSEISSYREILPGKEYQPPPPQNKLNPIKMNFEDFTRSMWNQETEDTSLSQALSLLVSGISPFSAREICKKAGLDPDLSTEYCGELELRQIFHYLAELIQQIDQGHTHPSVLLNRMGPVEYAPFSLEANPALGERVITFSSLHEACGYFYQEKIDTMRFQSSKGNLHKTIRDIMSRTTKRNWHQEQDYAQARKKQKYRNWGELLTTYAHMLKKGMTETELDDFYTGEKILIKLDPRYTPIQNAQKYFKKYNKSQKALNHLTPLLEENRQEIAYLASIILSLEQAENPQELREIVTELEKGGYIKQHSKKPAPPVRSAPRKFISSDGYQIIVGKNNHQNDFITLKQGQKDDLWLHSKNIPGAHVMVKLEGKIPHINALPDHTLEEAAGLAAYFSQACQAEKVEVDYTFQAHVKKPGGAKPGMVIYHPYWTILASPQSDRIKKLLAQEIKD